MFFIISVVTTEIGIVLFFKVASKLRQLMCMRKQEPEGGERLKKVHKYIRRIVKRHVRELTFNIPIKLFSEAIVQLSIAWFLFNNLPKEQWEIQFAEAPKSTKAAWLFSYFCLGMTGIYMLLALAIQFVPHKTLMWSRCRIYIGAMYPTISFLDRGKFIYILLFGARRILLSYIAVYWQNIAGIQLVCLMYFNLACLIYVVQFRPFKLRTMNRMEAFNESCIYLNSILLSTFSEYYENPDFKYKIGWSFISVIGVCVFLNFLPYFSSIFRHIRLIILKYYKRFRAW